MRHLDFMMVPISSPQSMLQPVQPVSQPVSSASSKTPEGDEALKAVAADFEAAFIAQMLTHSGLADALTSGEGKMASAFGSFFVEQLAEQMSEMGGIGMADSIYKQLTRYEQGDM